MIEIDLGKQQLLDAHPKAIQKFFFNGNVRFRFSIFHKEILKYYSFFCFNLISV